MTQTKPFFKLLRINQWIKNLLVFVGIIYSKEITDLQLWLEVITIALSFCLISSSVYIMNDIHDRHSDSHHPIKSQRPIASGQINLPFARISCFLLLILSLFLAAVVSQAALLIVFIYFGINLIYSKVLKKILIIDVCCIAAGFILRILAGTIGVGITPSLWLIVVATMLTLLIGFGKRRAEINIVGKELKYTRPGLKKYHGRIYDDLIILFALLSIVSYAFYCIFSSPNHYLLLTLPFSIAGILRYLQLLYRTHDTDDPILIVFKDKIFMLNLIFWLVLTLFLQGLTE